jgi:hypothetical protein
MTSSDFPIGPEGTNRSKHDAAGETFDPSDASTFSADGSEASSELSYHTQPWPVRKPTISWQLIVIRRPA